MSARPPCVCTAEMCLTYLAVPPRGRRVARLAFGIAFVLADAAFAWGLFYSCTTTLFARAVAFGAAGFVITIVEIVHAFMVMGPPR